MKIKTMRTKLKLTQVEMARLMGMPQQAVSKIETGERNETRQHKAFLRVLAEIMRIQKQMGVDLP